MSSYCDLDKLKNDSVNHPNFTARLEKWKSGINGINGCVLGSGTGANGCLTEEEAACYMSNVLGSKRSELDGSLRMIYQPQNAMAMSLDSNFHATMLTGVVWAMLGTTVLYYAFTKI